MEEIIDVQEEESEEAATSDTLEFPQLTSLSLEKMPNLRTFSYGKYCIHCPSLTRLKIFGCPKMTTFSSFEGKQQLMTADIGIQQASSHINSSLSLPVFFNERVHFPSLEQLELSSMCELKRIWPNQLHGQSFCKLESLTIGLCENLLHVFPSNSMERLQSLNKIEVVECPSLEALFEPISLSAEKRQKPLVFSGLKKMKMLNLPRLRDIFKSDCKVTLAFPSLMEVNVSHCHSLPYLFSSAMAIALDKLAVLDVSCCNNLRGIIAMENGEGNTVETLKFRHLSTLKLGDLENLISFRSTSSAGDGLHPLFDEKVLFPNLEELTLMSLCGLMKIWHNELSEESFCKLASITVRDCENLSHIFPSTLIERFRSLKMIEVVKCTSLEALVEHVDVNTKKRQKRLAFLDLKEVKLWDLPRLNAFVTSSTEATLSFPSLTNVSLRCCHSLRYLFTNDTFKTPDKLEMLDVSGCNNMQEVVAVDESEEQKLKAVKFSHLRTLKLCSLKSLISFSSGSCAYEFPSLRNLSILECTELKAFIGRPPAPSVEMMNEGSAGFDECPHSLFDDKVVFPKLEELRLTGIQSRELWENETPDESICQLKVLEVKQCPNLLNVIPSFMWKRLLHCMESLTVEECPRLRNLFTMSMAKSLLQLKYLVLGGCGDMEYIVVREEEESKEAGIIVIPQLVTLYLHKMIKLRSFCHEEHISEWPSLKEFTVEDCKAVEVILGDASCRRLEGSIPTQQPLLLVEKVELESMKISHMDNVEKIWLDELALNAFSKLETLIVEYCEKLSSIFSPHIILTRFQNLEKITVTDCGSLEVVFHAQEFNLSEACSTSTFELRELVLMRLPKMKHVWSGQPCGTLTFKCLQCLKADKCESLKSLFPLSVAKTMTRLKVLIVRDCGVEEIIVEEDGVGISAANHFFPQLTDLRLLDLPKLRSFYKNSHTSAWPLLKELQVRHCGKMRSLSFASEFQIYEGTTTSENQPALFSFEKVMPNLEGSTLTREDVARMQLQQYDIFGNLRELSLGCYHDENVAFPSNFLLQRFPNLEQLVVDCSSFEEIFSEDASGHGGATPYGELIDVEKPLKALGNLKRLDLYKLCSLRRIWRDGSLMAEILKQIEVLVVVECPNLSIAFPSPTSFQRLTQLGVDNCAGLVHMGTCSAVTSLVHLTSLLLRNCSAMEDVVTDDGNGAKEISFPKLEMLILDDLPSLESFSPTNCTFKFPSLEGIIVKQCPKMNIFCKGALRTPNLDIVLLSFDENDDGRWEGDLNTTIQILST